MQFPDHSPPSSPTEKQKSSSFLNSPALPQGKGGNFSATPHYELGKTSSIKNIYQQNVLQSAKVETKNESVEEDDDFEEIDPDYYKWENSSQERKNQNWDDRWLDEAEQLAYSDKENSSIEGKSFGASNWEDDFDSIQNDELPRPKLRGEGLYLQGKENILSVKRQLRLQTNDNYDCR